MNLSFDIFLLLRENFPNDLIRVILNVLVESNLDIDTLELTIKNVFEKLKRSNQCYEKITCDLTWKTIYYYEQTKRGLDAHYRICVNINTGDYWSSYRRNMKEQFQQIISQNEYMIIENMTPYKYVDFNVDLYIKNGKFKHSENYIRRYNKAKYIKYKEKNKRKDNSMYEYPVL